MHNRKKTKATVRHIVGLLAAGDYDALGKLSDESLPADQIRWAVDDYGGTVLPEPFELDGPHPLNDEVGWWVDVDLYTVEEGRSDLALSLTLRESEEPLYRVEIDNLHVL